MEPDNTARDAAMARLEAFLGEWVMEARFPHGDGGTGRAVFEWALDRQNLAELHKAERRPRLSAGGR
jgi:hypothetical protein